MLDHLTVPKRQARVASALDPLLASKNLEKIVRYYIIACKQEGKSIRTIETYSMVLNRYLKYAGNNEHSKTLIRQFLLSLKEDGLAPSSVHIYYRGLKTFFNWMVDEPFIDKSPMENINPPIIPKYVIKPFSNEDIDNMLLLCSGSRLIERRNRAIILVFLDTGIRLSEMARLQLKDVDFDRENIKIMGKGSKERFVRIGKTAQKALLKYILSRTDDYPCLWVTEESIPITRDGIKIMVKRICRLAEVKDARPGSHTFRHTFAINFLRNGGGEFALQIILGHSTLAMTRRYVSTLNSEDAFKAHVQAGPVDRLFQK